MTPPPDSDLTAPKDPAAYRPRALLGVGFWAAMVFGVLCVLAGVALATFGPRWLAKRPVPAAAAEPAAPAERPAAAAAAPLTAIPPAPPPVASADVERLTARVTALEGQEGRTSQAAAAALAAAAVVEASQGSGPFAEQFASLTALSPPSPELASLARLAQAGAPSRAALAASFPDYAARAASAARAPGEGAGLGDQIAYALSRIVSLRRVGQVPGNGVDAILARAEQQVEDGDLARALTTLDRLPEKPRAALADWRARAERRADIDRTAAAIRAHALQALAARSGSGA